MKKKSRIFYLLGMTFSTILPAGYIMYVTGVFEEGFVVTTTSISTGVVAGLTLIALVFIKDFHKRATDIYNTNYKQRALGRALFRLTPWILAIALSYMIYHGIASIYIHVLMISGSQAVASVFIGFEQYYMLLERKEFNNQNTV